MWKKEYAERRRAKYHADAEERARRRAQSRSPEENQDYMRTYYAANKERWAERRKANADERNRRRRERYATDPVYAEKQRAFARARDKAKRRQARLRAAFGLDSAAWDALLAQQGGGCAICGVAAGDALQRHLYVDHCHLTGAVRGLLCSACNLALGQFKDDPALLERAIAYLTAARPT